MAYRFFSLRVFGICSAFGAYGLSTGLLFVAVLVRTQATVENDEDLWLRFA